VRASDEGSIGKLIVETVILLTARTQTDGGKTLRTAAQVYGVDTDAIAIKVKQEFAAKEKARKAAKSEHVLPTRRASACPYTCRDYYLTYSPSPHRGSIAGKLAGDKLFCP
jgi:hypothetical protein